LLIRVGNRDDGSFVTPVDEGAPEVRQSYLELLGIFRERVAKDGDADAPAAVARVGQRPGSSLEVLPSDG
jgi:hypothetical protein